MAEGARGLRVYDSGAVLSPQCNCPPGTEWMVADAFAMLVYTSGTTAEPKGGCHPARTCRHNGTGEVLKHELRAWARTQAKEVAA